MMGIKRFDNIKIIRSIHSFFKLSAEEKEIYYKEIYRENTRHAFYLSLIAIPVSIIHIILFALKLKVVTGIEKQWVFSIICTHLSLFVIATFSGIFLYFFSYRGKRNNLTSRIYTNVLLILILVLGNVLTGFDQYVTPAITPFLNSTILVSLLFQIRPALSTIYFTVSYIIFYFVISQTQLNQDILISNQVNAISITAIGLSLSIILWRSKVTRILQREQIIRQNKALLEANAQKDKFFSIIAHDLINPFNSILGFSDLLINQIKEKDYDAVEEYAKIIRQSTTSAMDLLMNLMEWSRAHTGKMEFKPEDIELKWVLKESEHLFAGALMQKKIDLTLNIPEDTVVYADKNMIRTILRNLISNAIKFTNCNGHIEVTVLKSLQEFLISVSDNGVGIPKESLDMLFRIDQNNSTRGTQNESGTGLGLILCRELIEKHNGRIWCESEPGKGSIFYFSLPYHACNTSSGREAKTGTIFVAKPLPTLHLGT
jgi:signal transduction histidine kinase